MALTVAINAVMVASVLAAILSLLGMAIRSPRADRPVPTTARRRAPAPQRTPTRGRSVAQAGQPAADLS